MPVAFDVESPLPVAVIGAGPVGLAAAAHLLAQGEEPIIFEAGPGVGANVLAWGHVRLFSPGATRSIVPPVRCSVRAVTGLHRMAMSIPRAASSSRNIWPRWRPCLPSAPG